MLDTNRFEEFIAQYPIYEYRLIDTTEIEVKERVRIICKEECERYGTTWACPPGVGDLKECSARIHSYPNGILFSSVAEVSDVMNMEEMLATRDAHEQLTTQVAEFLHQEGFETFTLSTESCDLCEHCAYLEGKPCRFPEKMVSSMEAYGVLVLEVCKTNDLPYYYGTDTMTYTSCFLLF